MVFLTKRLTRTICAEPAHLGVHLKRHIKEKLQRLVEGMPVDEEGVVVAVTQYDEDDVRHGVVDPLDGSVKYRVAFTALIFRPFKNEIVDAVVIAVAEVRAPPRAPPPSPPTPSPHARGLRQGHFFAAIGTLTVIVPSMVSA
jgi:DNA-directed RNA polymerase subunit E'/Rpb7